MRAPDMSGLRRTGPAPAQPQARVENVAVEFMSLVLKVLGERTMTLASHLFPLLALGGGFFLGMKMIETPPTNSQLIAFGIYSTFALLLVWRRR